MSNSNPPDCYGSSWDQNTSECAGGYDPAYISMSGSHIRKKCEYFDSCKVRFLLKQSNQGQNQNAQAKPQPQQQWNPWAAAQPQNPWQPFQPIRQPQGQQPQPQQNQPVPQGQQMMAPPPQMQQMMAMMQQYQQMQQMMAMMGGGMGQMGMSPGNQMYPPFLFPPSPQNIPYQMAPLQMMPTYYDMPAYLSAPEPVSPGESLWYPLGREVLRGMGKALGHSIAHFFDHIALGGRG